MDLQYQEEESDDEDDIASYEAMLKKMVRAIVLIASTLPAHFDCFVSAATK